MREFALSRVETEKSSGFDGEGGSDVHQIEAPRAEARRMPLGQAFREFKRGRRKGPEDKYVFEDVLFEGVIGGVPVLSGESLAEYSQLDRVAQLDLAKRRDQDRLSNSAHDRDGRGGMDIRRVERDEETGIGVANQ